MGNINIRALTPEDCDDLIAIRLEALESHPNFFLANLEATRKLPREEWVKRLNSKTGCIFGLFDERNLIGITGIRITDDSPDEAIMIMSYIKPQYRGNGYSDLFYDARIQWAQKQDTIKTIKVSHRVNNIPSKRAIMKHGFEYSEKETVNWPCGTQDEEYIYRLQIS